MRHANRGTGWLRPSRSLWASARLQLCIVDRQLSQALASCRKDRVGYCRDDQRSPGLAHSAWWLRTLDDVDLDGRRLIDTQDLVGIEVGLLDTSVFEGDLAIERRRDAEVDRALDLRPDGVGIDDGAAIDRADNAPDTNRPVPRHFDFGNLRHIGREDELDRDAAADPFRQRLSPAGLFCGKLEDSVGEGRFVEENPPIGDRLLLRRRRQFVHEAFSHEYVMRRPDAAPKGSRNARRLHPQILDVHVREGIGQIDRTLGGVGVETIVEQRRGPPRDDGRAREAMVPGDGHPFLIKTGEYPIEETGPVHVVLDIFFARPDDLDWTIDMFGDLDSANDAIDLQTTTEAATDQMIVDYDLVQRQARGLRRRRLGSREDLVADPDFAAVLADMNCTVHRLHRGVREERNLISRLDLGDGARHRLGYIADILRHGARILRRLLEIMQDVVRVELCVRTGVPFDHQGRQPLLRSPHMVGHDGDSVVKPHDLAHALDGLGRRIVQVRHTAAEDWRLYKGRDLYARGPNVDAVDGRSVDF